MAAMALRSEERIGLGVAVAAHIALVALLLFKPHMGQVVTPPDRIAVTISDDVGLTSTSPEPAAEAAPDIAPDIGEPQPAAEPAPVAAPRPEPPVAQPPPRPQPQPQPRPVAKPTMRPEPPRPVAKPAMRPTPAPRPSTSPPPLPGMARPNRAARPNPAARPGQAARPTPVTKPGGARVGADFLRGVSGAQANGQSRNPPAAAIGPAVQSALAGAITRQLKPRWAAPQGAEAELLVTILSWNLNPDGSLNGSPRVVRQDGITDANRPQAARHAEQAIRAVELAAPFDLPDRYYDAWKRVAQFRFDKRLSQ